VSRATWPPPALCGLRGRFGGHPCDLTPPGASALASALHLTGASAGMCSIARGVRGWPYLPRSRWNSLRVVHRSHGDGTARAGGPPGECCLSNRCVPGSSPGLATHNGLGEPFPLLGVASRTANRAFKKGIVRPRSPIWGLRESPMHSCVSRPSWPGDDPPAKPPRPPHR
jgi:hypothetical protein